MFVSDRLTSPGRCCDAAPLSQRGKLTRHQARVTDQLSEPDSKLINSFSRSVSGDKSD